MCGEGLYDQRDTKEWLDDNWRDKLEFGRPYEKDHYKAIKKCGRIGKHCDRSLGSGEYYG
jgi:putative SOS response-associated peptidase YedK